MPIPAADVQWFYTTKSGSAGHSLTGSPSSSLGKYMSTTQVDVSVQLGNLFDSISGDENASGTVDYRGVFVANMTATGLTMGGVKAFIDSQDPGGASITIALDPTGIVPIGQAAAQMLQLVDELDSTGALAGLTFSAPVSDATGLLAGDVAPSQGFGIWVRRAALASAPMDEDTASLAVAYDNPGG